MRHLAEKSFTLTCCVAKRNARGALVQSALFFAATSAACTAGTARLLQKIQSDQTTYRSPAVGTPHALLSVSNDKENAMELHHPDFAELGNLRLQPSDAAPSARHALPPSMISPPDDENLELALHAWN